MTINYSITVNGTRQFVDVDAEMPLLWVLRDEINLHGTKYGCGIGICGACTVLIDGVAIRSCTLKIDDVEGEVTTIEGISESDSPHPVQQAWIDQQVSQCGYCQPGQIISTVAMLQNNLSPDNDEIDKALFGNLCRCGTYSRIRSAVKSAAKEIKLNNNDNS